METRDDCSKQGAKCCYLVDAMAWLSLLQVLLVCPAVLVAQDALQEFLQLPGVHATCEDLLMRKVAASWNEAARRCLEDPGGLLWPARAPNPKLRTTTLR